MSDSPYKMDWIPLGSDVNSDRAVCVVILEPAVASNWEVIGSVKSPSNPVARRPVSECNLNGLIGTRGTNTLAKTLKPPSLISCTCLGRRYDAGSQVVLLRKRFKWLIDIRFSYHSVQTSRRIYDQSACSHCTLQPSRRPHVRSRRRSYACRVFQVTRLPLPDSGRDRYVDAIISRIYFVALKNYAIDFICLLV